ncbi:MAG: alkaline phosphatase, partial [Clostridia bacterium]|nr:alkaline phosphatase [Clostridia bacterium]
MVKNEKRLDFTTILLYNKEKKYWSFAMSERFIYKNVVVVGLDGMGVYNKNAKTPNLDRIFVNGAVTYSALSMSPTSSAENWGAMLLGASPEIHKISNELDMNRRNTGEKFPSVFKRLREVMPDARLSSFVNWKPINNGIIEDGLNVIMDNGKDDELCDKIVAEIKNKPAFLFIQFDEIDGAGHGFGYGSDGYLAQIEKEDAYVGRIYDAYVENGLIDDTLFIVVADHGGILVGHGSYTDEEKYIYLALTGKSVQQGEIGPAYTRDISSIVLYALGVDYPEYDEKGYSSQVPDGIFAEINGKYKKVEAKDLYFEPRQTPEYDGEKGLS